MLEKFERFTQRAKSFQPKVSIRKRGQIALNSGAIQKFGLEKYNYVVLFMSKDRQKIAIMFTNDRNEEGAIKLLKRQGNFSFSAKSFCDFYGIDCSQTRSYDAEWIAKEHAIVIDISKK